MRAPGRPLLVVELENEALREKRTSSAGNLIPLVPPPVPFRAKGRGNLSVVLNSARPLFPGSTAKILCHNACCFPMLAASISPSGGSGGTPEGARQGTAFKLSTIQKFQSSETHVLIEKLARVTL